MKFTIEGPLKDNAYSLMRKAGYYFQDRNNKSELIFLRPLVASGYPRFHIYLKIENDNLFFSLHLDQKKPSYKGSPAHSGEYDGEIIEAEMQRIKQAIKNN